MSTFTVSNMNHNAFSSEKGVLESSFAKLGLLGASTAASTEGNRPIASNLSSPSFRCKRSSKPDFESRTSSETRRKNGTSGNTNRRPRSDSEIPKGGIGVDRFVAAKAASSGVP
ncbi:hypothetical protein, partial [Candidatus Neomicrothrix sp.]|uniref:hypothetical protein n=1 Tax=Candidatus Neomicrothrix sp. TaxID=2719034 RepID=UPI001B70565B